MSTHRAASLFPAVFAAILLASSCGGASRTPVVTDLAMPAPTAATTAPAAPEFPYPAAPRSDVVDNYHGTEVADPYRWLEDADAADTAAWVTAENELTFGFLGTIPERERIRARLAEVWNFERYGVPHREGKRFFFQKNDGLQNQSVLYVADALDAAPRVLLDPNTLSTDGTVALAGYEVSDDGNHLAYGLATSGSDWNEWRVREVATGKDLADSVKWIKFSGASWTKDSTGFFYSRYAAPTEGGALEETNYFQKLYFHKIGDTQEQDTLIYERKDQKEWGFGANVTEDGRYLVITVWAGTDPKNQVFYKDLKAKKNVVIELITGFANGYEYVGNDGTVFYFRTDLDAPRGRIMAIDLAKPDRKNWKEIVPQAAETIDGVTALGGNKLIVNYLKDARTAVRIFGLDGKHVRDVELPGIGTATGFGGRRTDKETFFAFSAYTAPPTIYRYDLATGAAVVHRQPKTVFDPSGYETKQVFYASKDGTRVPMFVTSKKGLVLDGTNPTYLYGYGGFNVPLTPSFSPAVAVWLELGGVYAVANLRGGGEYGEEWHKAGTMLKKQNVFDDFIAAAEWLIANGYTTTPKLAIGGGSNGGLLVGACITQRPELYGAALPDVGVLDMLRFHKFTIGWAWIDDYGSSDDAEQFRALVAYSPYHNVKEGTHYPATLISTADHDDRVVPGHSFKFAAALQAVQTGDRPVLIRVDVKAGHGAGKPTSKLIDHVADKWSFLVKVLGIALPVPQ